MSKLTWWDQAFGDIGWREARAINDVAAGVEFNQLTTSSNAAQIGRLLKLDVAQGEEIERLRLTVKVLTETLVDTLGLDEKVLGYRMEAAMADLAAIREQAMAEGNKVSCGRCGVQVPASHTEITQVGVVCDRCALAEP